MRKKATASPGGILAIPIGDRFALGKIVFVSSRFKNVMLIRLFQTVVPHAQLPKELSRVFLDGVIFTGIQAVENGRWPLIGQVPVDPAEIELSRRIVAGRVYLGDEELGRASLEDERRLPQMDVDGAILVERKAARLLHP